MDSEWEGNGEWSKGHFTSVESTPGTDVGVVTGLPRGLGLVGEHVRLSGSRRIRPPTPWSTRRAPGLTRSSVPAHGGPLSLLPGSLSGKDWGIEVSKGQKDKDTIAGNRYQ